MKISFEVKRDMEKCKDCKDNPKNMTIIQRIKNKFESFSTACGLCTAEEISNKLKR